MGFTTDTKYTASADPKDCVVRAVNEFGGLSPLSSNGSTGVTDIESADGFEIVAVYDINGIRLKSPVPGLNIIVKENPAGMRKVEKLMIHK